ncbi:histone-like nucleoid-structuring protein Lsr2 [Streptomyces sp. NPDC049555]|uniref:Lsr2 family DNA-binding protein n=1 Tax=Streptomyces sp. NPDC049555 TaxID=3154930 RepID=UPI0034353F81
MRKTVLVPVRKSFCDAHIAKDGSEVEATATLSLGSFAWDLCLEHDVVFGRYLTDALGVPAEAPAALVVTEQNDAESLGQPPAIEGRTSDSGGQTPTMSVSGQDEPEDDDDPAEGERGEPVRPSVMVSGEVPGYTIDEAREAVRNCGYDVVGRADDSTVLIICGEGAERNATKLADARARDVPCMDATAPGRFKSAVRAGEFTGGDPLPEPVKIGRSGVSARERNRLVRSWARDNGFTVPEKGRIPMHVRHAYELNRQTEAVEETVAA